VVIAWLWLRHQPDSTLSRWFHERVSRNGGRFRKTASCLQVAPFQTLACPVAAKGDHQIGESDQPLALFINENFGLASGATTRGASLIVLEEI
jgi:hypothetical protein